MKRTMSMSAAVLAALLVAVPQVSLADHRGYGGHYGGGVPWWWILPPLAVMATLPYRTYDPQPVIIQQTAPPTVIVQPASQQAALQQPAQYWYYCAAPKGYYPYVASCPDGWRPVSPIPADVPQ
jgi:hypothetical protein